ncbi:hypothetical protein ACJMK2_007238 [Sinanodonta woodiana]|uniref:Secreted protein n=1 Tax=Sinanodonta woodiana TaxID=1069815 RepID=A0ABD3VKE9_SINWO
MSKLLLMLVFASALAVFVVPSEGYGYSFHHHHNRCICVPDRIACPCADGCTAADTGDIKIRHYNVQSCTLLDLSLGYTIIDYMRSIQILLSDVFVYLYLFI